MCSDHVPSCRHSEEEEPRSSSVNLIVAMDRRGLLTDGVLIVFGGWTMVHRSVVLCSAAAADWHVVLSVE